MGGDDRLKMGKQGKNSVLQALGEVRGKSMPRERRARQECGDVGLKIGRDGTWYYQDSPIGRRPLVKLFASVLRLEADGQYYLVTPAEKALVRVEDAPFLAVAMEAKGGGKRQRLSFRTNLDEVVEARKDTVVIIHPLTDHRRRLPIEKLGTIVEAPSDFMLVVSYNPGYQSILKDLKQSTRQRFVAIEFDYPPREQETTIIQHEAGIDERTAGDLAKLGEKVRNLREHGLAEGVSTRLLVYAGKLMRKGIPARAACQSAIIWALTDDAEVQRTLEEVVSSIFE